MSDQLPDDVIVLPADPDAPIPLVPVEVRLDQLPAAVTELLAAVVDALDMPMSHWAAEDERAHHRILTDRASDACIILAAVIRGDRITDCTRQLRSWTADRPVTYTPRPEQTDGGAR